MVGNPPDTPAPRLPTRVSNSRVNAVFRLLRLSVEIAPVNLASEIPRDLFESLKNAEISLDEQAIGEHHLVPALDVLARVDHRLTAF